MKPKLTLRDLFWLVLVCAVAFCSWAEQRRRAETFDREVERLEQEIEAQAKINATLQSEIAQTTKATQWARDLYRDSSDHIRIPSNAEAIEFAGKSWAKRKEILITDDVP